MKTRVTSMVIAAALTVLAVASVAFAGGTAQPKAAPATTTINIVEHPINEVVTDTGKKGDSAGDLLTFHNPLFDETNTKMIGQEQGTCVRINPRTGAWECAWTNFLPGGHVTVEGPFFDTHDSMVAVTGGTGSYKDVSGEMRLHAAGAVFHYTFKLVQ
jgi:hypothetical protein